MEHDKKPAEEWGKVELDDYCYTVRCDIVIRKDRSFPGCDCYRCERSAEMMGRPVWEGYWAFLDRARRLREGGGDE
jgi:hypothetical protein